MATVRLGSPVLNYQKKPAEFEVDLQNRTEVLRETIQRPEITNIFNVKTYS